MKGDMFHVAAIVHAKQLHSVLTFLADKRAWNVESRPLRQEKKSGGESKRGGNNVEIGHQRSEAIVQMLSENGVMMPSNINKQLDALGIKAQNVYGILTRMVEKKLIKKTAKGYEAK